MNDEERGILTDHVYSYFNSVTGGHMTKFEKWARHGLSDPMLVYIARSLIEEGQADEREAVRLAKNFREGWNVGDLENEIQLYANEYDQVVNCG